jgi:hypothetical protein
VQLVEAVVVVVVVAGGVGWGVGGAVVSAEIIYCWSVSVWHCGRVWRALVHCVCLMQARGMAASADLHRGCKRAAQCNGSLNIVSM